MAGATPGNPAISRLTWVSIACGLLGIIALALSLATSWWHVTLYSPGHPRGLSVSVSIGGLSGELRQLGVLTDDARREANHGRDYHYFARILALLGMSVVGSAFAAGRRFGSLVALPVLLFPVCYVASSLYQFRSFAGKIELGVSARSLGVNLHMLGDGQLGPYLTHSEPGLGFWLGLLGALGVIVGVSAHCRDQSCDRVPGKTQARAQPLLPNSSAPPVLGELASEVSSVRPRHDTRHF